MRILITGAANGIGAATVTRALVDGHEVVAVDLDESALEQRWGNNKAVRTAMLDVRDAAAWQQLVDDLEQHGWPIDVLVNVAGVLRPGHTGDLIPDEIELALDVNVKGVIHGANTVAAAMKTRGAGHIINVGSTASLFATPGNTVYAASKFAVRGFTIAAAGDLRPYGIHMTLVGPTAVKTGMLEQQRGRKEAAMTFAGKRALTVTEVADAIIGKALRKRPLEMYLPASDEILGKLCASVPQFFLSQAEKARAKGEKNFASDEY